MPARDVGATGVKSPRNRERPPRFVCPRRQLRCVQQDVHPIADQLGN